MNLSTKLSRTRICIVQNAYERCFGEIKPKNMHLAKSVAKGYFLNPSAAPCMCMPVFGGDVFDVDKLDAEAGEPERDLLLVQSFPIYQGLGEVFPWRGEIQHELVPMNNRSHFTIAV